MYPFNTHGYKQKEIPAKNNEGHYLILASEPVDHLTTGHFSFNFRNRYLAKRRVMRTVRRLRRNQV